jgi:phage baseplate assembly protein W
MKQAWPNGGNVPFGSACQAACADTTAMQCAVSDAYSTEFQAKNPNAGLDASGYSCPPAPDGSAMVALVCSVEHYDPLGGCSWTNCTTGRRPEGLLPVLPSSRESPVAAYFGECARLEGASIVAFERMRAELKVLRAPHALVRSARRAARDETRHARVTRLLARRFGGRTSRPTFAPPRPRALVDMALENAAEGVVRETFGAAIALWQARHARDSEVRRAMRQIAEDECRHAELSWRVARWLHRKLTPAERERVSREIRKTIASLRTEVSRAPDRGVREVAGLPNAQQGRVLLALLERDVWA